MRARSSVWLYERSLKVLRGRDGANDFRQPSDNIDEEHLTLAREGSDLFTSTRFERSCQKRSPARDCTRLCAFLSSEPHEWSEYPESNGYDHHLYF